MKSLPIRVRLTLWYFFGFAGAALSLSLTSWWMLRHTLDATIRQDLQERVDDVRDQLRHLGPGIDVSTKRQVFTSIYQFRDDGKWLSIYSVGGGATQQVVYESPRMKSLDAAPASKSPPSTRSPVFDIQDGTRTIRLLTAEVTLNGESFRVNTGMSMTKSEALVHTFGLSLMLLTPLVLLMAALVGHIMSRKALAPVALITRQARFISEKNLESRLSVSETKDELSDLSVTLNHMLQRIDESFRRVRDFTANASHELRTPLSRIRTQIEIALFRPRTTAEYRQALERTLEDAVQMSALIEDLLTLSRADAGSAVLHLVPLDVSALLQDIVLEWRPVANRQNLRLLSEIEESGDVDEPALVYGDRGSLLRLSRILLDNACKFTEPGGTVRVRMVIDADAVIVEVADSGIGIAPAHQSRVFERFYREGRDAKTSRSGTGLGLSLALWIAEQHNTTISLDSDINRGARFQIRLNRVAGNAADDNRRRLIAEPLRSISIPPLSEPPLVFLGTDTKASERTEPTRQREQ